MHTGRQCRIRHGRPCRKDVRHSRDKNHPLSTKVNRVERIKFADNVERDKLSNPIVCRQFVRTSDKVETTSLGIHCRSTLVRHRTSRRQSTFDKTATKARQTRKSTSLSTFVLADGVEFDFVATV